MDHQSDRFDYLYRQYISRACTNEEMQELFEYVSNPEKKDRLDAIAYEHLEELQVPEKMPEIDWEYMYNKIIPQRGGRVIGMVWRKTGVAAAILILLAAGGYWWLVGTPKTDLATTTNKKQAVSHDVAPGGNKAVLKLADGSTIILDSAANGRLAQQGGSVVNKTKDGQLKYESAIGNRESAMAYNMLATPRGGQYQLVLPDGSAVWLNAASSIRFPTAFTGNERNVEITGEAYFEVKKNAAMPFTVKLNNGAAVRVLGTHFNINAYDDEASSKVTLLEGSVKVGIGNRQSAIDNNTVILKPGEQTSVSQSSHLSQPIPVQTDEVVAWKNGSFYFNNTDLQTIMRQVARWYDIDVEYKDVVKNDTLFLEVPRNTSLSEVLKVIESTAGVRLRIEGKKVTVL
jgi:transmembrane sensor